MLQMSSHGLTSTTQLFRQRPDGKLFERYNKQLIHLDTFQIAMQVVFINKPVFSDLLCNRCYSESKASFVVATSGSTCSWGSAG